MVICHVLVFTPQFLELNISLYVYYTKILPPSFNQLVACLDQCGLVACPVRLQMQRDVQVWGVIQFFVRLYPHPCRQYDALDDYL